MHAILALVAATTLGLDQGWEPLADGGVEFIVQIDPADVDQFVNAKDIISDAPAGLDIRRVRVTVGRAKLNRELPQAKENIAAAPAKETPVPVLGLATLSTAIGHTVQKPTFGKDPEPTDEEMSRIAPRLPRFSEQSNGYRPTETAEDRDPTKTAPTERFKAPSLPEYDDRRTADVRNEENLGTNRSRKYTASESRSEDPPKREARAETDRDNQWGSLFAIFFFLMISIGANFWLGWIAFEARTRYQILLDKYRSQGGKASLELA